FDNTKVIFYLTSETRVDFRELVKDLASHFRIRIELRQVGIRDEAKLLGGLGPCGRACCCSSCLGDFARVSIKMAKTQGLSLNPGKISGLCGRLMCCLQYENEYYSETYKLMPKINSEIKTPDGKAIVMSNDMLKKVVTAKITSADGSVEIKQYPLDKIKAKHTLSVDDDDVSDDLKNILD
ncbi:MAG: stage 0 sporulation protein, partial [Clostridia bacterium]|nr:stage 0 sporulation protein [Clostridia bacterium]